MLMENQEFIEITTKIGCPISCKRYCPQEVLVRRYADEQHLLGLNDFSKMLLTVPKNVVVSFAGFCEPFANPDCIKMIQLAHKLGHKIHIFTTLVGASESDVKALVKIPYEIFCLHQSDGNHFKLSRAIPDRTKRLQHLENELMVRERVPNLNVVIMNDLFVSNNRENMAHGILPKKHSVQHCIKFKHPQFVVLPNGDVQICCMDYGLDATLGNLLRESYVEIRERFLKNPRKYARICGYCLWNERYIFHFAGLLYKKVRKIVQEKHV